MSRRHAEALPVREADASMTLLKEVDRRPLDPGYQEAADRRAAGTAPRRTVVSAIGLLVLAVALGMFATTSATALRRPAPAAIQARALLEAEIRERTAQADELRVLNADLSAQIAQLQGRAAATDDPELFAQLQHDAVPAGVVPVSGPGLRIVVTDGDEEAVADDIGALVLDVDLQILVNGLWAAGAEAVALNGERVISTTAIRSAGDAVLIDSTPLSSPYTVEAIGDAATMQTRMARQYAGQHLASLAGYGIDVQVSAQRMLELPGRGQLTLRSARVLGGDDADAGTGTAGATSDPGPTPSDVAGSGSPDGEEAP
ncbi:DUF881 domain-containing protein [Cellulomonas sp. KH9]|uniref:DUF881 domain-containing protein n=1 Tax=Cellulomonas sp. KH9 TaxID=1855324 RepID=UPI0008E1BD2B|nr:DUF881 domain-containing protein [Cellulomonas sp. KH9]SFJ97875.1 Uncharacterized conserved protein YlxW, UPF0749 family [Cellulomonas sp. KH9]